MQSEDLFDRMKEYEAREERVLMPRLPVLARLDGRSFSRFTRHSKKPFSPTFVNAMNDLARYMLDETGAHVAFTASDELTLVWYYSTDSQPFFGGRVQKMASQLAALASVRFNQVGPTMEPSLGAASGLDWVSGPTFDARVWTVPTLDEAANVFIWRQADAARNSVMMLARTYFSHSQVSNKSISEMQEMLFDKFGINWNDTEPRYKRGTFFLRRRVKRNFTPEEIEQLPKKHNARKDPNYIFSRAEVAQEDLWLSKVTNRVDVLFNGAVASVALER